jgi:hypothetical protein
MAVKLQTSIVSHQTQKNFVICEPKAICGSPDFQSTLYHILNDNTFWHVSAKLGAILQRFQIPLKMPSGGATALQAVFSMGNYVNSMGYCGQPGCLTI